MFGHQDDQQQDTTAIPQQSIDGVLGDAASVAPDAQAWQHPGMPLDAQNQGSVNQTMVPIASDVAAPSVPVDTNELLDIKHQALGALSPLVGHLEQSPEEKFRTTMMMIQASDNQSLIKEAYIAAQAIPDEKQRAQALLDVVNEINYFTQQPVEQ